MPGAFWHRERTVNRLTRSWPGSRLLVHYSSAWRRRLPVSFTSGAEGYINWRFRSARLDNTNRYVDFFQPPHGRGHWLEHSLSPSSSTGEPDHWWSGPSCYRNCTWYKPDQWRSNSGFEYNFSGDCRLFICTISESTQWHLHRASFVFIQWRLLSRHPVCPATRQRSALYSTAVSQLDF